MSKMDGLRAMREARYEKAAARAVKPDAETDARQRWTPRPPEEAPPAAATPDEAPGTQECGHRNMGGRTCTRELGHAAKSHRYS